MGWPRGLRVGSISKSSTSNELTTASSFVSTLVPNAARLNPGGRVVLEERPYAAEGVLVIREHFGRGVNRAELIDRRVRVEESSAEAQQRVDRIGVGRRLEPVLVVEV